MGILCFYCLGILFCGGRISPVLRVLLTVFVTSQQSDLLPVILLGRGVGNVFQQYLYRACQRTHADDGSHAVGGVDGGIHGRCAADLLGINVGLIA